MTYLALGDARPLHATLGTRQLASFDVVVHGLQDARSDGARVGSVGVQRLDDFFDGHWGFAHAPGIVVGRRADEGVAVFISITLNCWGRRYRNTSVGRLLFGRFDLVY